MDRKVVQGEFINIKTTGTAPCQRFGHTMSYLPVNSAIIIAGGRNDSLCKETITPLLNDIHLFLLDQKVWIRVKHSYNSDNLNHVGNHTMGVITDGDSFERIIVFGGIENEIKGADAGNVLSFLSNKCYSINVTQRSSGRSFFRDVAAVKPTKRN